MIKTFGFLILLLSVSGCASLGKDKNPTQLEKSPCACGEIYNSNEAVG